MIRLRRSLRVLALVGVLGAISITPVLAQSTAPAPVQTIASCDGQTFDGQSLDTQNQFIAAYGQNAANVWVQQHDAAATATGYCAAPAVPVAAASAPIVIVEKSSNSNNNNDNNGNDNDDDHHRPSVSLDISRNEVDQNERFDIRVTGHREGDSHLEKIWWWATDTNDNRLRDTHTRDCSGSDECRETWQESSDDSGRTIRIHAMARNRDGRDSDEVTRDIHVR